MTVTPKALNQHTRASFVRRGVEENEITKHVIDACMPYFPKSTQVIGGYVDVGKQYWKANFHWEYLLSYIDKALALGLDAGLTKAATAIRAVHAKNPPNPDKGYMASRVMGIPKDSSSKELMVKRWVTTKQSKKDFKRVIDKANLLKGLTEKQQKSWLLAVAPVARPGTSKHSTGYALDLYGDNKENARISASLGASLVFPEGSHVHVEFAKGVGGKPLPRIGAAAATAPAHDVHYTEDACVLSPVELAQLKQSLSDAPATGAFGDDVPYLGVLKGLLDRIM
jgi:hypothetical protein